MRRVVLWMGCAAVAAMVLLAGCGSSGPKEDPILRLSAEEALEQGKKLLEEEKYTQAQEYLNHAYEVEPNSAVGREGLLLAADALFKAGGQDNYIRAEAKYRDFQNRFPTSDKSAYVLFQVASSLAQRVRKPDRDQSSTAKALQAFHDVISLYPTSEYAEQARQQIDELRQHLGESEFLVGHFYYRAGLARAAIARFEGIEKNYADYQEMDEVVYFLANSYRKSKQWQKAVDTFERLGRDYPESEFLKKIPDLDDLRRKAAAAAAEAAAAEKKKAEEKGDESGDEKDSGKGEGG
jgi:outer membrane protein assembly factor BamD